MDYQIVPKINKQRFMFVISLIIFSLLPYCVCILNRDLVLTPKQGLQLSGKRIFYEEDFSNHNGSVAIAVAETSSRPWERTLKHVTYLTLFTNAANGIITGNFSKVKEYNDFLNSIYVRSTKPIDSRFGDIVTLADGRLETMANGSYRFVEGNCDYECARESNIIAMWHVQKIRHRDTADHKYHYEMKFSVSPMTAKTATETLVRGGPNKRTIKEERQNSNMKTFIQKEDDYPHSFRKIVSDKDEDFFERRSDAARNFRQVNSQYQKPQVTPIPQSTFLRSVYHHKPPPHQQIPHTNLPPQNSAHAHSQPQHYHHHQQQTPLQERLNMGEFYKGNYVPESTSKIELFPNLLNMLMGGKHQHSLFTPTTFRPPPLQVKFPRPEIYHLQRQLTPEFSKFSEYQQPALPQLQEQFKQRIPSQIPIVTHHYHHHYFMPNNSAITIEQAVQHSSKQNSVSPAELYPNEVTDLATRQGYVTSLYEEPLPTTIGQHHFPKIEQHPIQTQYRPNFEQGNLTKNYHSNYHIQQLVPAAPHKFVFPITQIEQQRVVHVTPAPPLKKPDYAQQHNRPFTSSLEYTTVHVPLLISYPAPINEEMRADIPTPRNKPFVQSEPIEDTIHYSEPDPLYTNVNGAENENQNIFIADEEQQQQEGSQEPQLESPDHVLYDPNQQEQNIEEHDSRKEHSESVEAQLPAPSSSEETITLENAKHNASSGILGKNKSQSSPNANQIEKELTTANPIKTEGLSTITSATKRPKISALRNKRISIKTGTTTSSTSTIKKSANLPSSTMSSKSRNEFISTSSTESPLRAISRYRNSYARTGTTTSEKPVLKWAPKGKSRTNTKYKAIKNTTPANQNKETDGKYDKDDKDNEYDNDENEDFKTNESNNLRKAKSLMLTTTLPNFALEKTTTTEMPNAITIRFSSTMTTLSSSPHQSPTPSLHPLLLHTSQAETDIYEVLTQKSVSKSVSLKVGQNGEEISVLVDDDENEVNKV